MSLAVAAACLLGPACRRENPAPPPAAAAPTTETPRPNLTPLGNPPDWGKLQPLQGTVSREEFERQLTTVYALPGAWQSTLSLNSDAVSIRRETASAKAETYLLRFAAAAPARPPRYWRPAAELPPLRDPARPLEGIHIALDPGHIGGNWAHMEERSWRHSADQQPIKEGDITLTTARLLQPMLEELGAKVSLVRSRLDPVTPLRPADFLSAATAELLKPGSGTSEAPPPRTVQTHAEKLFYRTAEIRARAAMINDHLRPDLVVCLHFNAAPWGPSGASAFSPENHLHLIVNGAYSLEELMLDDQRFEMLTRLLQGIHDEEAAVSDAVARSLAVATALPAYVYRTGNALPVARNPYVWARNLLANRLYQCPVVFCEPYVMNNQEVYERVQAGDFAGETEIHGKQVRSIFREYARGVAEGLKAYYAGTRPLVEDK
ncbi:MAG: N-acetylmuramoyl-L-alanine amidase [Verrucomicrobiales bacterium]|nr:N-acetylmuramoyl-L-alanine amidase [Verrucomicrobiales bacterium]